MFFHFDSVNVVILGDSVSQMSAKIFVKMGVANWGFRCWRTDAISFAWNRSQWEGMFFLCCHLLCSEVVIRPRLTAGDSVWRFTYRGGIPSFGFRMLLYQSCAFACATWITRVVFFFALCLCGKKISTSLQNQVIPIISRGDGRIKYTEWH